MQIAANPTNVAAFLKPADAQISSASSLNSILSQYQIIRRNGAVVPFEPAKIAVAMMKAFLAVHGAQGAASSSVRETVDQLTQAVVRALMRSRPGGGTFHIEDVQDQVELGLMRGTTKWHAPMCCTANAVRKNAQRKRKHWSATTPYCMCCSMARASRLTQRACVN